MIDVTVITGPKTTADSAREGRLIVAAGPVEKKRKILKKVLKKVKK